MAEFSSSLSRRELLLGSAGLLALSSCRSTAATPVPTAVAKRNTIDIDAFVADCVAASEETNAQEAVKEVLARGVREPRAMLNAVGAPDKAGLKVFHQSTTLTVFAATWTPLMNLMPHNHRMWALIGIYTGREDNIFWRRTKSGVRAFGANCLFEGDVAALPESAIHSVTNPLDRFTGGVHIYGGDFFGTQRSQWNPETLAEEPSDGAVIRGIFDRANERMRRMSRG